MTDQEFAEWCGFKRLKPGRGGYHFRATKKVWNWLPPSESERHKSIPFLPDFNDLTTLFKHAVPQLKKEWRNWKSVLHDWVDGLTGDYDKDALALHQAIENLIGGTDES